MATRSIQRKACLEKRSQLTKTQHQVCSQRINAALIKLPIFIQSKTIAFYASHNREISLHHAIQIAWSNNQQILLPSIRPQHRTCYFYPYKPTDTFTMNHHGIYQIQNPSLPPIKPDSIDLVIVPIVAIDPQGNRLGHGKGYYDHTFSHKISAPNCRPYLLAVGYDFQRQAAIISKPWDVPCDSILLTTTSTRNTSASKQKVTHIICNPNINLTHPSA